ncbi:MAG: kelch repeat-containing protein [Gemmataceae bacterium]
MRTLLTSALALALATGVSAADGFPPTPQAFSSFGATVSNGYAYVYGGHAGKTHSYSVDTTVGVLRRIKLDDPKTGWEELPGSEHLQGLALVTYGDSVIRIGGMAPRNKAGEKSDNHSVATVEKYEPARKAWTKLPDLPAPRSSHDAVVIGDTLYVFGGWQMKGSEKTTWFNTGVKLDLTAKDAKWETVPQPFLRRALTAAAFDGKVYVICGLTEDGDTSHEINIYDPKTNSWSKGPDLPGEGMNGFTPAACVANNKLYVSPADGALYKLTGDKWETCGKLEKGRWVHRMVTDGNGHLIVLGGASKGGNVSAVEVIEVK